MPNARLATARVCTVPLRAERIRKVSGVCSVRSACAHRAMCCNTIAPRRANPRKQLRIAKYTENQAERARDGPDRATGGCTMRAPLVRNAVLHSLHLRTHCESVTSDLSAGFSAQRAVEWRLRHVSPMTLSAPRSVVACIANNAQAAKVNERRREWARQTHRRCASTVRHIIDKHRR